MDDQIKKTTQTKIKKLKKDIELFQLKVDHLLECMPITSTDNTCIICGNTKVECADLPCPHVICKNCYKIKIKNKDPVKCPVCQQQSNQYTILYSVGSSFSSEEN